jgi:hypothetical protein
MMRDLSYALDPVIFATDCGVIPDGWQAELLRNRPRRSLLLCSRQSGKTTVTGLTALWTAIFEAPALVVIVSPSQRQSAEMFRTIMRFHANLEGAPSLDSESVLKAELANGSRILALPGSERTVRGLANVSLAIVDEAARVEGRAQREVPRAGIECDHSHISNQSTAPLAWRRCSASVAAKSDMER